MKHSRPFFLSVPFLIFVLFFFLNFPHFSRVQPAKAAIDIVYVEPSGDCNGMTPCFNRLQEGVDFVSAGGTVKVSEGIYTSTLIEVLNISKSITINHSPHQ